MLIAQRRTVSFDLVRDFGAQSGTTADVATINDNALKAFQTEAQKWTRPPEGDYTGYPGYYPTASKDILITLTIPAGHYVYNYNNWHWWIRNLRVVGAGSGLRDPNAPVTYWQNINGYSDASGLPHLRVPDYFWNDYGYGTLTGDRYGSLVQTAPAGTTQVVLKDASHTSRFYVGRWVLIYSRSQQPWGYPPNMRYYDWAKVTRIDAASGTVFLDTPTKFEHRSDRPYSVALLLADPPPTNSPEDQVGPARLLQIDTPVKPVVEWAEFSGFRVLENPNWTSTHVESYNWFYGGFIDGRADDMWYTHSVNWDQMRSFWMSRSKWTFDESDKVIGQLTYHRCDVETTLLHSGQLRWQVLGGRIGSTSVACRSAYFGGGLVIDGPSYRDDEGVYLDRPNQVRDVTFDGVTLKGGAPYYRRVIGANPLRTFLVDGTDVTLPDGPNTSRLQIAKKGFIGDNDEARNIVYCDWGEGDTIQRNGAMVRGATVSLITGDDAYIYVTVTGATFNVGDKLGAYRISSLTVRNCIGVGTGAMSKPFDWLDFPQITWTGNTGD